MRNKLRPIHPGEILREDASNRISAGLQAPTALVLAHSNQAAIFNLVLIASLLLCAGCRRPPASSEESLAPGPNEKK
jgi:hypothetical protein